MDLFNYGYSEELTQSLKLRRIKYLSLFSGIGAFEKALKNLGMDFELVGYSEIDKYASKAYSAIHGVSEGMNLWDVKSIDTSKLPNDIDLITYGFPCQDISISGHLKGFWNSDGSLTRSGLFFEALRIIKDTQPVVAIAENVKNLMSESFRNIYHTVVNGLGGAGYNSYVKILNAKDFGIPQNRERVFIVSIRKDKDMGFEFPATRPLELRLKDLLEDDVDKKYYLSDVMMDYITLNINNQKEAGETLKPRVIGGFGNRCNNDTQWHYQNRIYDNEVATAVTTEIHPNYIDREARVRKLTPKECFRVMGFEDEDFNKASKVNSDSQLYKRAGNSIVVNVLEALFMQLKPYFKHDNTAKAVDS